MCIRDRAITEGVCTALPVYLEVAYSLIDTTTTAPTFDIYFHPIRMSLTQVADTTGGLIPVERPESETTPFTGTGAENPTLLPAVSLPYQDNNKLHRARFGPFNIQDFYEGDGIAVEAQVSSRGTPATNIAIWGMAFIGYRWTNGLRGF